MAGVLAPHIHSKASKQFLLYVAGVLVPERK